MSDQLLEFSFFVPVRLQTEPTGPGYLKLEKKLKLNRPAVHIRNYVEYNITQ